MITDLKQNPDHLEHAIASFYQPSLFRTLGNKPREVYSTEDTK